MVAELLYFGGGLSTNRYLTRTPPTSAYSNYGNGTASPVFPITCQYKATITFKNRAGGYPDIPYGECYAYRTMTHITDYQAGNQTFSLPTPATYNTPPGGWYMQCDVRSELLGYVGTSQELNFRILYGWYNSASVGPVTQLILRTYCNVDTLLRPRAGFSRGRTDNGIWFNLEQPISVAKLSKNSSTIDIQGRSLSQAYNGDSNRIRIRKNGVTYAIDTGTSSFGVGLRYRSGVYVKTPAGNRGFFKLGPLYESS